jgi:hypothetical protein
MVKLISLFGLYTLFVASFFSNLHVYGANSVYISEINYNGSSVSGGDKWVEIYNASNNSVDITGWKINMPNSSKSGIVALSGSIPANSPFVVGVKNAKFSNLFSTSDISNYNITNISNTQAGEVNYINIQLINASGSIISQVKKDDDYVRSLGISNKGGIKHSLECDAQSLCSLSTKLYGGTGLDFGTPGVPIIPVISVETTPIKAIDSVQIQTQVIPPTISEPVYISEVVSEPNPNTVKISEPNLNTSPVLNPIPLPQLNLQTNTVKVPDVEPALFTVPEISLKTAPRTSLPDLKIPEIKLQTFSSKIQSTSYKSAFYPEVQLFSLVVFTGYTIVSKTRFSSRGFVKA